MFYTVLDISSSVFRSDKSRLEFGLSRDASVINRANGPPIVVTRGRTKLPLSKNNLYTSSPQGACIVSALWAKPTSSDRSDGDQRWDPPCGDLSSSPPCELVARVFERCERISFRNSCRTPRVAAIGSAALIITARGTRSLSWDRARFFAPTANPRRRTPFGASLPFFWRARGSRDTGPIEMHAGGSDYEYHGFKAFRSRYYRVTCYSGSFMLTIVCLKHCY